MNKLLVTAAMAGVMAASASTGAVAADKEKCYGVAEAGKNDCASADGSHSCAGHASKDKDSNEWKYVAKGECEGMGGSLKAGEAAKNSCEGKNSCKGEAKDGKHGCEGKNSCKGKDAKEGKHSCEGKNSCKGKDAKEGKHSCEGKNGCEGKK